MTTVARGRPVLGCAVALLSLLATGALVAAQDVASSPFLQRYSIEGRVIGANELPLAGREVVVTMIGENMTIPCEGGHANVTDAWGDFRFCWEHGRLASGARAEIAVGEMTRTVQLDPTFRRSYVALQDAQAEGAAPPGWNETYLLTGRAWTARPVVELQLIGLAVPGIAVNLTVKQGEMTTTQNATTDDDGDFAFTVTTGDPRNTSVTVEIAGQGQTGILDPAWHRHHTPYIVRPLEDFSGLDGGTRTRGEGAPGSSTPTVSPWLVLAGALGLAVAVVAAARAKKWKK